MPFACGSGDPTCKQRVVSGDPSLATWLLLGCGGRSGAQFFGNFFSFCGFKIHWDFQTVCQHKQADHALIGRSDLQVCFYIAFVVDAHDRGAACCFSHRLALGSEGGLDLQAAQGFGGAMTVEFRDLGPGDIDWLVAEHGRLYARDEGFDESFPVLVREILVDFEAGHDATCERAFVAWEGAQRLGSVFCMRADDRTAKLRLFFLLPEARGKGLGRGLLEACTGFARDCGYQRMVLWTHESHRAACALYEKAGWRMVRREPKRSFGVDVVEQGWEVDL